MPYKRKLNRNIILVTFNKLSTKYRYGSVKLNGGCKAGPKGFT